MPPDDTLSLLRAGKLKGTHRLDLRADLTEFPPEIYDLVDALEILDLSSNRLSELPADLPRLKNLRVLFCGGNQFTRLPEVLGQCPNLEMLGFRNNTISEIPPGALPPKLRWLVLTDNRLAELPTEIGNCKRLQKLMLSGNLLADLPEEMSQLKSLELLRIAANRFERLPDFLLQLPRLAWLAFAGNPCSTAAESSVDSIDWDRLDLQQKLGEGASGVIHKARWKPEGSTIPREVAVKLFKGSITSDGLPENEIAACLAVGQHPNLIGTFGKIHNHPEETAGLVMPLINPEFKNLAGPPDLKTCTQDIYPEDLHFPLHIAKKLARCIASAAARLHSCGVLHGDLYAHNILWHSDGECFLGDFGAASFYPESSPKQLEAIEIRAFGHLLGELLSRAVRDDSNTGEIEELLALKDHCLCPDPEYRPTFQQIQLFLGDH